jgi:type II secretion system protein G
MSAPTRRSGFTLIEILIVLVILSIIASLVVPNIMSRPDDARVTVAKADIRAVSNALELYKFDNFQYPSTQQGLMALVKKPAGYPVPKNWKQDGYLKTVPVDPWGNPYQYQQPGTHGAYDVYSYGADGKLGGDAYNKDIGNWE